MKRLFLVNASFVGLFASWTSSAQDTVAVQSVATEAAATANSPTGMLLTGLAVMVAIAVRRLRARG